ncbi:MAG: hypothetical protein KJN69_11740 [Gammaproteobacteria bacterium]|nr:hypothetical protein [Gammaproteobacteria bacterium]
MRIFLTTICFAGSILVACAANEPSASPINKAAFSASTKDFHSLQGDEWVGNLSYLNYDSKERSAIPVKLRLTILSDQVLQYAIQYPGEEQYNSKQKILISRNGTSIDGYKLTAREKKPDGTLVLITEGTGRDDNRRADIQMVYTISESEFSIRKNVRFRENTTYFNRNEYSFSR